MTKGRTGEWHRVRTDRVNFRVLQSGSEAGAAKSGEARPDRRDSGALNRRDPGALPGALEQTERAAPGPPLARPGETLLLLHGYPETALAWRKTLPTLSSRFSVIAPDLPGYGESTISDPSTYTYDKRSVAQDIIDLLDRIAGGAVHLVGHDRGARVAYRLALDHPDRVRTLTLLATVPTLEVFNATDYKVAQGMYHWNFLAQPYPLPEKLLEGRADFFIRHTVGQWCGTDGAIEDDAMDAYIAAFSRPEVVHSTCEDYRAGISTDMRLDQEDLNRGNRIACPTLVVWGSKTLRYVPDVVGLWRRWATDVRGVQVAGGHFVMEECPNEVAELIASFCSGSL